MCCGGSAVDLSHGALEALDADARQPTVPVTIAVRLSEFTDMADLTIAIAGEPLDQRLYYIRVGKTGARRSCWMRCLFSE
jgi:hypothetical protein